MRALRPGEKTTVVLVISFLIALGASFGLISITTPPPNRASAPPYGPQSSTPFIWPGKTRPPTVSAAAADLPDDEPVLGVLANGKARAYRRQAFAGIVNHVVNDVVGETPVTVTHCDRSGCSRVFTGDGKDPLPFKTGGFLDGMLIYIDGVFYDQSTGEAMNDPSARQIPYQHLGFEETTWGKWRAAHPNTDVYLGSPAEGPTGPIVKE
jgi:Protein of unknown function (DUF3179)